MIKLTYEELNQAAMEMALARLAQERLPVKVGWNIQRILRQVEKEIKEGREIYMKLLKDCCELDDKGNFIPRKRPPIVKEDGSTEEGQPIPGSYIVKDEELFKKRNAEFLLIELELQSHPIQLKDLEQLQMSSADLAALAPLIHDGELKICE